MIEVRASSFRRLRGLTCAAIICDEAAYWLPDDISANPHGNSHRMSAHAGDNGRAVDCDQ